MSVIGHLANPRSFRSRMHQLLLEDSRWQQRATSKTKLGFKNKAKEEDDVLPNEFLATWTHPIRELVVVESGCCHDPGFLTDVSK